jgi:hypothetical protein
MADDRSKVGKAPRDRIVRRKFARRQGEKSKSGLGRAVRAALVGLRLTDPITGKRPVRKGAMRAGARRDRRVMPLAKPRPAASSLPLSDD